MNLYEKAEAAILEVLAPLVEGKEYGNVIICASMDKKNGLTFHSIDGCKKWLPSLSDALAQETDAARKARLLSEADEMERSAKRMREEAMK